MCSQKSVSSLGKKLGVELTLDMLQRRGVPLVNGCFLCQQCEESANHLLLHYSITRILWELHFSLFGATWIMSGFVLALHGSCRALFEIWFWAGKALLLAREERKYGKQLLLACFGQCGRLEIELC